ncbi:DUF4124 domain-containing protein [Aromatoleum evansii]|uniref:DUF4124 domain-containing protein n=1 Tax=Aromatoleum evansii TaxID=59406 RepID=UPI00145ED6E3|nr:DUF4124 domain-containing protein [Aromatoleum evansii]NMG30889.1 DUF4124 domain-containing protein [Aromatoleum evansii]
MSRRNLHAIAVVATAFTLVPAAGQAQVFKCAPANGQTSYQALPCNDEGARIDLPVHAPTPRERVAAQARARKEQGFVSEIESARETAKRSARAELKRRDDEREAHAARCASYQERADRADADARMHLRRNRYKRDHEARARALRDRYFSECFAAD